MNPSPTASPTSAAAPPEPRAGSARRRTLAARLFTVDTRELGRSPGSVLHVDREVPAPPQVGLELIRVVPGSPVRLRLTCEAVVEGVLVSGSIRAETAGECGRCLQPIRAQVEARVCELYAYPDAAARLRPTHGEPDELTLTGEFADLEPLVRDALVLALPLTPLCAADCPGLCQRCGARLAEEPDHDHARPTDPRWAGLDALSMHPD